MMLTQRQKAEQTAKLYIAKDQLLKELGSGADGFVFPTAIATAIKVFSHKEMFDRELAAYKRLQRHKVISVAGFAVPRLINSHSRLLVIEMTMVEPPFLLDFAQSEIDKEPDFPEGLEEWWVRVEELFGDRFSIVQSAFYELQRYGIYYYDLAPRNVHFADDPK
jgi:hypothetical protein